MADGFAPQIAGRISRRQVEEARRVERLRRPRGVVVGEVEVLEIRAGVERVAKVVGLVEATAQHLTGIAEEWLAVEHRDVAEHAGDRLIGSPGEQLERGGIRAGEHVRLDVAAVAVNGRAIEGHALFERVLELGRGDREALQEPEDIGEPEVDETDTALLDGSQHVVMLALRAVG